MMNFGIIGAGLIGKKRGEAIHALGGKISAVFDVDQKRASALASEFNSTAEASLDSLLEHKEIEHVVIAAYHNELPKLTTQALRAGKNVLVEKPAGRISAEIKSIREEAQRSKRTVRVGFNHRFHPALLDAKKIVESGTFGPLMYIRARYGHGGRIGYEKEWRANPKLSGGGELIDQGSHLIDLSRWIGNGDFHREWSKAERHFWQMPVDDNAFLFLKSSDGLRSAFLHASCTEWKNLFHFEIFCKAAKIEVTGLGRSYGAEELKIWKMLPEMGPPDLETRSYPGPDTSWESETKAFLDAVSGKASFCGTLEDAEENLRIIEETYRHSGYSW
jgi:predicted dehydrogenase